MVTGASVSDLAVLLVDARKGLLVQTRRHAAIASLLGIRQLVLAVNKMDLVGFDQNVFDRMDGWMSRKARSTGGLTPTHSPPAADSPFRAFLADSRDGLDLFL